jgi:hypothetical protein
MVIEPVANRTSWRFPTTLVVDPLGTVIDRPVITHASELLGVDLYAAHSGEFVVSIFGGRVMSDGGGSTQTLTYEPSQTAATLPSSGALSMIGGALSLGASIVMLPGALAEKLQPTRTSAKTDARIAAVYSSRSSQLVADPPDVSVITLLRAISAGDGVRSRRIAGYGATNSGNPSSVAMWFISDTTELSLLGSTDSCTDSHSAPNGVARLASVG